MAEKTGALRIWYVPDFPGEPFYATVGSPQEANTVLQTLEDYDEFLYRTHDGGDGVYSDGLEVFDGEEWAEWRNEAGETLGAAFVEQDEGM